MEAVYQNLAHIIRTKAADTKSRPYLVAIAGPPGSGKTTVALKVARLLSIATPNYATDESLMIDGKCRLQKITVDFAQVVGMDGFHLPRCQLDKMPNRAEAYRRRGAPWTFDAEGLLELVRQLRLRADQNDDENSAVYEEPILAPSFDHAVKDPVLDSIRIDPDTSIIILEGLYLFLDQPTWREIAPLFDMHIFVDVDPEIARMRVARRHLGAGIESTLEDAIARVDRNDTLNGELIRRNMVNCVDMFVDSIEELLI